MTPTKEQIQNATYALLKPYIENPKFLKALDAKLIIEFMALGWEKQCIKLTDFSESGIWGLFERRNGYIFLNP